MSAIGLRVIAFHDPLLPWQRVILSFPEDAPKLLDTANTRTSAGVMEATRRMTAALIQLRAQA